MDTLISVIVPVYNVKQYLETCVNSILDQTYKYLEILLIDDGSTDGSGELCEIIKDKDSRISVYHKANGGLSDARNYGIEKSKGDFYAFIDSDDALHKDFFRELMAAQKESCSDIVACDMTLFNNQDELQDLFMMTNTTSRRVYSKEDALKEYFSPAAGRKIHHGLCMKIYSRHLFDELRFEVGRLHEDLYITYRLIDNANSLVYVDCPYYFYFQNNTGSICKNYGVKNYLDESEAYTRIYRYFKGQNRVSDELLHFLIIQYLLMFEKAYDIRKMEEISVADKEAKKWVKNYIGKCTHFGIIKKLLIKMSLRDIRIYSVLKKIRGR